MKKKAFAFLSLTVALSVLFCSCSSQSKGESSVSESVSQATSEVLQTTEEAKTTEIEPPTTAAISKSTTENTTATATEPSPPPAVSENAEPSLDSSYITLSKTEQELFEKTNLLRSTLGLYKYKINYDLCKVAREKAQNIIDLGYFDHLSPNLGYANDMLNRAGIEFKSAGENLAKGKLVPSSTLLGWYNSPGHKEALLNETYKEIGIGVVDGAEGISYWVQIFIDPK